MTHKHATILAAMKLTEAQFDAAQAEGARDAMMMAEYELRSRIATNTERLVHAMKRLADGVARDAADLASGLDNYSFEYGRQAQDIDGWLAENRALRAAVTELHAAAKWAAK